MRKLVLATTNKGKVAELRSLLAELPVEIVGLDHFTNVPEVAETGTTFLENAALKAKAIGEFTGALALADDSGLEVDALGGEPGVYSARYGEPGWNDRQRFEHLLEKIKGFPATERAARFQAAVAFYDPAGQVLETATGAVEGQIIDEPRGSNGFGYDPIFFLPEYGQTMAEIGSQHKNELSHRARAVKALLPLLRNYLEKNLNRCPST